MGAKARVGLVIVALGVIGFLIGSQSVQEAQTATGQVERAVSEQAQSEYQGYKILQIGGAATGILGLGLVVLDIASTSSAENRSDGIKRSPRDSVVVQKEDRTLIKAGSYGIIDFDVGHDAVLEYAVKVIEGPPINVIVTDERHLDEFKEYGESRWVEHASALGAREVNKRVEIGPRDYVLILDNTGRVGNHEATGSVEVSVSLTVSKR